MEAYLPLAQEQRKQGKYNEALLTLKQAIALFPANSDFYRQRGLIYSQRGRFEEAMEAFRTAVTLNSKDDHAWSCLGGLLRKLEQEAHIATGMPYVKLEIVSRKLWR